MCMLRGDGFTAGNALVDLYYRMGDSLWGRCKRKPMTSRVLTEAITAGGLLERDTNRQRSPVRAAFKLTSKTAPLMPHMVIAELADGDVVFRYAGTGLVERQGMNITGKRYGDFAEPLQVARAAARIKAFHATPCGFASVHREGYQRGFAAEVEVVGFPLRADNGEGRLIVMVVTPLGTVPYTETGGRPIFMAPATHFDYRCRAGIAGR